MKRILSKFGAYTQHLSTISEDLSVKSIKLRGYYLQWTHAKYIVGSALFIDLLIPCSIFSKVMQSDEIDIFAALTNLLKTLREMEKLSSKPLSEWAILLVLNLSNRVRAQWVVLLLFWMIQRTVLLCLLVIVKMTMTLAGLMNGIL